MAQGQLTADVTVNHRWHRLPEVLLERLGLQAQLHKRTSAGVPVEEGSLALIFDVAGAEHLQRAQEVDDAYQPVIAMAEQEFDDVLTTDGSFAALVNSCALTSLDARVLAIVLAIETIGRCRDLAALTGCGANAGRATPQLIEQLLGSDALRSLAPDAPLVRAALLAVDGTPSFAVAEILLARQVVWRQLEAGTRDPALPSGAKVRGLPPTMVDGIEGLVVVHGEDPTRRVQTALVSLWGLGFLITDPPVDEVGWRAVVRQASLDGLSVVLTLQDELSPIGREWIERASHLSWALCSKDPLPLEALPERPYLEVEAAAPEILEQEWSNVFPGWPQPSRKPSAEQLRLIRTAAREGEDPSVVMRRLASGSLLRHARRISPRVGWEDLILPPVQENRLRSLVDRYRHRSVVHDDWGLPLYPSPGVVALFSGPSGTGKTTTAEVIAGELGVDMFRVDLSALVSKYIGETEKNLEEIFSAAHAGDYLLLFDEADSLFGSRSKVTDARDRYANMEVSYLLQRLETYDGFVVLTSNFQGNIDQAFLRRIHVTVHFPVPSAHDRERIWARSLAHAPTDGLDLAFVAEKFDLAGGSIRNTALSAAFFAAAQQSPVGMVHVLRAISQELTKLGRRPTDDQFGRWHAEVAAEG
ncbi:ATP-binding protein [Jatrophihabitans sp. DSM 45814]